MSWISDAGPYAVALGGIGAATWSATWSTRHQRRLADLEHLRGIVEEAAVALDRADYARSVAVRALADHGTRVHQRAAPAVRELDAAGRELDRLRARLSVRAGRGTALAQALDGATDALRTGRGSLWTLQFYEPDHHFAIEISHGAARELDDEAFEVQRQAFVDEASRLAAVDLEAPSARERMKRGTNRGTNLSESQVPSDE